jgi:hypothetical protein
VALSLLRCVIKELSYIVVGISIFKIEIIYLPAKRGGQTCRSKSPLSVFISDVTPILLGIVIDGKKSGINR